MKSHSHDYFHLLSIVSGKISYTLGNTEYVLEKGDIVLADKGTVHRFENNFSEDANYYEVKFTVLNRPLAQALANSEEKIFHDDYASQLVAHIADEYLHNRTLKEESSSAALETLIYYLTSETRFTSRGEPGVIDASGYSPLAKRVISLLTDRYAESLTLDQISESVGTTKNYLCNAFKRNTGMTIIDCLNMIRIRKAAELIVYSDLPLSQVAQMCGYVSVSHFNRVFMRYVGLPPGQCRRAYSYDLLLREGDVRRQEGSFMYSVLAGKCISPDTINELELSKSKSADANN